MKHILTGSYSLNMRSIMLISLMSTFTLPVSANVAQIPLSLTEGVPPNMILSVDDSGSMRWAFTPDSMGRETSGIRNTRRVKSPTYNLMYFNPDITYQTPFYIDSNNQTNRYTTSYTSAHENGFRPSKNWTRNLASDYVVSWNHETDSSGTPSYTFSSSVTYTGSTGTIFRLAENPESDFSCSVTITTNNTTRSCTTSAGIRIDIRRGNGAQQSRCTVSSPTLPGSGECIRQGSTSNYTGSWVQRSVPAYYYVYDTSLPACTNNNPENDACYRLQFVTAAQQQNFAIWYSFYRTRALATQSAANIAFNTLSPSVRLTWQDLGSCSPGDGNCGNNLLRPFSTDHRKALFDWIANDITFNRGTPLRATMVRAGEYLSTSPPWRNNPALAGNTTTNPSLSCRASYHILMTDGMWNGSLTSSQQPGNADNSDWTLPDGNNYTPRRPFMDNTSNTLADVAFHYWATDLRPTLDNNVPKYMRFTAGSDGGYWDPRNNPANWQHMSNFIVGLALSTALNNPDIPWSGDTFSGTGYQNLLANTNWPAASASSDNNVYDLWHAAINSRGEFFSADSPESLVQAFSDILERIMERQSTAARPGVSSSIEDDSDSGNRLVRYFHQSSYASDQNWAGDLTRTARWRSFSPAQGWVSNQEVQWSARTQLATKSPESRNINIAANTSETGLQAFTWNNAGNPSTQGTLANYLNRNPEAGDAVDSNGSARLDFLRGVRNQEGGLFRERYAVLGDIFSSAPVVVTGARMLQTRANAIEGNTKYTAFRNTQTSRRSQVYVGANDGMLHAFDTTTGEEKFAFIPTAVFPKLHKLTGKNYSHEFYVDGTPVVADVYDGVNWRTILVGTLRAGGRGLFGLDITDPDDIKLLWEFDDSSITDEDAVKLGYSFPQPTVARLRNGKWAVVTGNGYHANGHMDGRAALFIIDAIDGSLVKSLEVQGIAATANGLSAPRLADNNGDGFADYAYAGDLQGNLWRFDLLGDNASPTRNRTEGSIYGDRNGSDVNFKVSYGGQPMFTATSTIGSNPQPITGQPSLVRHPTRKGYIVVFGTGKYFETGDNTALTSHAQSLYGIWDRFTQAETTTEQTITRAQLQQQTLLSNVTGTHSITNDTTPARTLSNNTVNWFDSNGDIDRWGWYLDLQVGSTREGEMIIESMINLGNTLFIQSLVPNDDPCEPGNQNWLYAINPATGGKTLHFAFDYRLVITTPDGTIIEGVSGVRLDGEGGISVTQDASGRFQIHTGQDEIFVNPDLESLGRQSWRTIMTDIRLEDENDEDENEDEDEQDPNSDDG